MPDIVSHGAWERGPDAQASGFRFQTYARADGVDWYAHAHAHLYVSRARSHPHHL